MEFLDEIALQCVNSDLKEGSKLNTSSKTKSALFFELSSTSEAYLQEQVENIKWLAEENSGKNFDFKSDLSERNKLWAARHKAWFSMQKYFNSISSLDSGRELYGYASDVCVPISKVAECVLKSKEIVAKTKYLNQQGGVIGHVGDGNFHVNFGIDTECPKQFAELKMVADQIAALALENDGTITGEHGIGLGKKHLLEQQVGSGSYGVMQAIKKVLDPNGIMNPGKVL